MSINFMGKDLIKCGDVAIHAVCIDWLEIGCWDI